MASKPAQRIRFFFCYQCKRYELKTNRHYEAQKRRFAERKKTRVSSEA